MPFGFQQYRLNEGITPQTIKYQVITLNQFFSFLNVKYKGVQIELDNISRKDITDFLEQQLNELKLDKSTVYRKQSTLRLFFDYLFKSDQIMIDPMVKFNYFKKAVPKPVKKAQGSKPTDKMEISYDYITLLNKKQELLSNPKVTLKIKVFAVLIIKGIQLCDIFNLTVEDFTKNQNTYKLSYKTKFNHISTVIFSNPLDVAVLDEIINDAQIKETPYLISTQKKDGSYQQSDVYNTRYYFTRMQKYIGFSLRSEHVRLTLVHYLHFHKELSPYDISKMLGRPLQNIFKLIDESLVRITNRNYNVTHVNSSEKIHQNFIDINTDTTTSEQLALSL